ncbi:MAG: vWA domain-containing protein, partial [Rubritalea sp.]|uniref:vWA domain-containing protein n=1 Tax=Rubritalea sp. TaxID=2109375 RepID=UPI0032420C67
AKGGLDYFEAYSVVAEANVGGVTWFQVTSEAVPRPKPVGWSPQVLGWMSDDEVVPWNQALVMKFTSPLGRSRSLFFSDSAILESMVKLGSDDRIKKTKELRAPLLNSAANMVKDPSIVGIEPILNLRKKREAVIFPILDYKEVRFKSPPLPTLVLQIAAKNAGKGNTATKLPVDVVFVMDTTGSTGPYIRGVLQAAQEASKDMVGNKTDMKFGLVGYRDNLNYLKKKFSRNPSKLAEINSMDYSVKTLTPDLVSLQDFVGILKDTEPVAKLTPDDVAEEVFEGIYQASVNVKWRPKAVKLIILIGDAPGHAADHLQSISGQDEMLLRAEMVRRNIGLFAIHIAKSKSGANYDKETKRQFMEVSRKDPQGSLVKGSGQAHYYSIDASDMNGFKNNLKGIFSEIKKSIDLVVEPKSSQDDVLTAGSTGSISDLIFDQASILLSDPDAPLSDFKGWTTDDALNEPGRKAMTPMILLTKDQLNQLNDSLKNIIRAGNDFKNSRKGGASSLDFFDMLQRNSGQVMKDPSAMNYKDVFGVPAGIDQLPYKSRILYLTREDFRQMGADNLNSLMFDLDRMRTHYQNLLRDQDAWKELVKGCALKDRVAGLELDMLP